METGLSRLQKPNSIPLGLTSGQHQCSQVQGEEAMVSVGCGLWPWVSPHPFLFVIRVFLNLILSHSCGLRNSMSVSTSCHCSTEFTRQASQSFPPCCLFIKQEVLDHSERIHLWNYQDLVLCGHVNTLLLYGYWSDLVLHFWVSFGKLFSHRIIRSLKFPIYLQR